MHSNISSYSQVHLAHQRERLTVTSSAITSWSLFGLVLLIAFLSWSCRRNGGSSSLPPGPPSRFLFGHLGLIPKENTAEAYAAWSKEYESDVIHLNSMGQSIIVLNSLKAARDLLDRRSANYSDRPRFTLFEEMGWRKTLTFLPYGHCWQMHRKVLQTTLSNTNVRQWQAFQVQEARRSARNILGCPDNWKTSLRRFAVAIVLKVSYGTDVFHDADPYIKIANDAMYAMGNGGAPANSIVDIFPPARFLPTWVLRDWPLKFARDWRWAIEKLHNVPFECARADAAIGRDNGSLAHKLLQTQASNESQAQGPTWSLEDIKGAAGAVFIAGADTTWATCTVFILNMVMHPEVQKKAQQEIDAAVGSDRLPDFSDRQKIPYIDYIVQECYRWSPLAPLGIPHKSINDDIYNGMLIPKGYAAGSFAMSRDESTYSNATEFRPDRYIPKTQGGAGEPYPVGHFGFGRRACVGRFLADNSIWMMVATMLATLSFEKRIDANGNVIQPQVAFTNGGTCHPKHFECTIRSRSPKAFALLRNSEGTQS
ncbi:Cytochrome P450 monooxygenase [Paramyrothecium foliicola]|nr:Cytochrome P450 monooxygenase [Paramyrothecium foliicola]